LVLTRESCAVIFNGTWLLEFATMS